MRLIYTPFKFSAFATLGFCLMLNLSVFAQQTHAKKVGYNSSHQLEGNEAEVGNAIQFSADVLSDAVELFWEVAAEKQLSGYELQRSVDGKEFEKVTWLNAVGENIGGTYLHLDESAFTNETLQYRIKAVRSDGQYIYSSTQIVDLQLTRPSIELTPTANVQPSIIALESQEIDYSKNIELLDAKGNLLISLDPTQQDLSMDFSKFKQGVYFIKMMQADGDNKLARVVKQE